MSSTYQARLARAQLRWEFFPKGEHNEHFSRYANRMWVEVLAALATYGAVVFGVRHFSPNFWQTRNAWMVGITEFDVLVIGAILIGNYLYIERARRKETRAAMEQFYLAHPYDHVLLWP
jgi:hypothetical protein